MSTIKEIIARERGQYHDPLGNLSAMLDRIEAAVNAEVERLEAMNASLHRAIANEQYNQYAVRTHTVKRGSKNYLKMMNVSSEGLKGRISDL